MQTIDQALAKLNKSGFRASFHLSEADRAYIEEKGMDTIRRHAEGFVLCRLSPAVIANDGAQTPRSGHPVFKAQHACACCCRECLYKWYGVPKGVQLTEDQQRRIVNLLMIWIERELRRGSAAAALSAARPAAAAERAEHRPAATGGGHEG